VVAVAQYKPGSSGQAKTSGNFTCVGSISIIENQYQQSTGGPLKDEAAKAPTVPVPAVFNTIGSLYAEKGIP
jgi:hypothetical protein